MQRLPLLRPGRSRRISRRQDRAAKAVALIGPPNSGKTTLFNRLTGLRQKVANFPGVTVEQHTGMAELPDGRAVQMIDLPGRLQPDAALGRRADRPRRPAPASAPTRPKPEAVLLVLDSTNLERHLMLAAPILSLGLPTLVILNMADDLRSRGGQLDLPRRSRRNWARRWRWSARGSGEGIDQVFDFLAGAMPKPAAHGTAGPAGRAQVPRSGPAGWAARPPIARRSRRKWTRRLDAVFLHPVARAAGLRRGGGRRCSRPSSASPIRSHGRASNWLIRRFRQLGCTACCPRRCSARC